MLTSSISGWIILTVSPYERQPNGVFTADVDLDNDFDILVTTRNAKGLFWYANPYFLSIDDAESLEDACCGSSCGCEEEKEEGDACCKDEPKEASETTEEKKE